MGKELFASMDLGTSPHSRDITIVASFVFLTTKEGEGQDASRMFKLQNSPWALIERATEATEQRSDAAAQLQIETLFCVGNGSLGVRGSLEETGVTKSSSSRPATFMNGVYDERPIRYPYSHYAASQSNTECFVVPVPQATGMDLWVGNDLFSLDAGSGGQCLGSERVLDMQSAELRRSVLWSSPTHLIATASLSSATSSNGSNTPVNTTTIPPSQYPPPPPPASPITGLAAMPGSR